MIIPELVGSSVHLRCIFSGVKTSGLPLGYLVVWARHLASNMKVEIRKDSIMETFSLVEMDGVHFRLGETVIMPARRVYVDVCVYVRVCELMCVRLCDGGLGVDPFW